MGGRLKRWYSDREEAIEAARGSGYLCWRIQRMVRVKNGLRWSIGRRPSGPVRYYLGVELPKYLRTSKYLVREVEKTTWTVL